MTSRQSRRLASRAFLTFSFIAVLAATANSAVIVGVVVNPPTTAGGGATSTRSGPGSFHIFAVDNDNLGISSYNLTMGPAVTASNNRSPVTTIQDGNGDYFSAGFNLLRTTSNAPQMQASQSLPGSSPYLIAGMGQTAGSFATIATTRGVQPGSVVGPTTSAAWGTYLTSAGDAASGKKWVFLGEGLWNTSMPLTSNLQIVSAAVTTVFNDAQTFVSIASPAFISGCFSVTCGPQVLDHEINNVDANNPGLLMHTFQAIGNPAITWSGFTFDSYVGPGTGPSNAATFDPATAKFTWNTVGSPLGTYKWLITASSAFGSDQGSLTVRITTVPEVTSLSLLCFGMFGGFGLIRRRP